MKLTVKFIADIDRPGRYGDDAAPGLSLLVQQGAKGLRKSWTQRLTIRGKRVDMGLGSARSEAASYLTPTAARQKAHDNNRIVRDGGDPRRGPAPEVPTFEAAAAAVIAIREPSWRHPKAAAQWRSSLTVHAGRLFQMSVSDIRPRDVLAVVEPIWNTKRETARRVLQRIGMVMRWAIAQGYREDNPAGDAVLVALPAHGQRREHFRALPYDRVAGAIARVRASNADITTALAFEFLVLTAARSGEVRGARWDDIDFDAAIWTVPATRMKAGREHRVPLSARALQVLSHVREYADRSGLVFPARRGGMISDMTMTKLIRELGIDAVPHGFRSSFRQWAAECSDVPREVAEAALAHMVRNPIEAAYQRSDLLARRRTLMDTWARYLT